MNTAPEPTAEEIAEYERVMSLNAVERRKHDVDKLETDAAIGVGLRSLLEAAWKDGYAKGHDDGFDDGVCK